ncbi:hypothetical protein INT47_004432 [Mucor saturninus]|uniref:Tc1-like transposase DDE domain-containing protein n=1 Tax=Mucor saturninus TaxID=64648 RepID=A0A8H7QH21_9FUNG|nr:hypothetical protein INT47_004432 [Mucor saturninus]
MSDNMNTRFFYEDGTGGIFDEQGQEVPSYVDDKSFRSKKLTELRKYIKNQEVQVEARSPADTKMKEAVPKKERDLQYNKAAIAANVNYATVRKWKQTYDDDPERNITIKKINKTIYRIVSQLNEAHKSHLIKFFDEDSTTTIQDAVEDLTAKFADLDIKKARVDEFMKEECNLSIKAVSRHPVARKKEENLQKRADWVEKWVQNRMDYLKNCIFVDDVLGAISAIGVVNMKLRESGNLKRRKVMGATNRKAPEGQLSVPKDTTGEHYPQCISDTMDIMDEFSEMKVYFIIMDNAPIHVIEIVDRIIMQRGYTPVYLPPWSIIKAKVRRTKLSDIETLTTRIIEASEALPIVHLESIIQHSVNQF